MLEARCQPFQGLLPNWPNGLESGQRTDTRLSPQKPATKLSVLGVPVPSEGGQKEAVWKHVGREGAILFETELNLQTRQVRPPGTENSGRVWCRRKGSGVASPTRKPRGRVETRAARHSW